MLLNRILVRCINWLDPIDGVGYFGLRKKAAHCLANLYWRRRLKQPRDPHDESVR